MNKETILKACQPYIKDNIIYINDFNRLYGMLNITKKNLILDILIENDIILLDKDNKIITNIEQNIEYEFINEFDIFLENNKINKEKEFEKESNKDLECDIEQLDEEGKKEHIPQIYELRNKQYKILNETLCTLIQCGKKEAKEIICKKNMNLVYDTARKYIKYYNHKLEMDDLFQAGMIGLLKAAEKYDKQMNTAFSTYAMFWIKQSIIRTILDTGLEIRIPVHMIETINKVMKESSLLDEKDYNNNKIIAEKLLIPVETVNKSKYIFDYILNTTSLDDTIGYDDTSSLKDIIEDKKAKLPEKIMLNHKLYKYLINILNELTEREKTIIFYRFGLKRDNSTLQQIGEMYGLTRERIRQIEAKVLKKLRAKAKKIKLEEYLNAH